MGLPGTSEAVASSWGTPESAQASSAASGVSESNNPGLHTPDSLPAQADRIFDSVLWSCRLSEHYRKHVAGGDGCEASPEPPVGVPAHLDIIEDEALFGNLLRMPKVKEKARAGSSHMLSNFKFIICLTQLVLFPSETCLVYVGKEYFSSLCIHLKLN
jgi:hypothetical protein